MAVAIALEVLPPLVLAMGFVSQGRLLRLGRKDGMGVLSACAESGERVGRGAGGRVSRGGLGLESVGILIEAGVKLLIDGLLWRRGECARIRVDKTAVSQIGLGNGIGVVPKAKYSHVLGVIVASFLEDRVASGGRVRVVGGAKGDRLGG